MGMRLLAVVLGLGLVVVLVLLWTAPAGSEPEGGLPESVAYETWYGGGSAVVFDHAAHLEMGFECTQCHHLETCGACHQEEESQQLVSDSKLAVHTACLACHEQGPRGGDCEQCHTGAEGTPPPAGVAASAKLDPAARDQILSAIAEVNAVGLAAERRPGMEEIGARSAPEAFTFVTNFNGTTLVPFRHDVHVEGYGLECSACHHLERCGVCHDPLQKTIAVSGTADALHANCIVCHEETSGPTGCAECHKTPSQ